MREETIKAIEEHAAECYPRESCGLIVSVRCKERYWPCRNLAETSEHFILDPLSYAAAEETGEVLAVVHSHPNASPLPSEPDLVACEASGLPWHIISWPNGTIHSFTPSGYKAPLIGRSFCFGVLDCYALARDYYRETLGLDVPDFERRDKFWERGENLFVENLEAAGFMRVDELQPHAALLIQVHSDIPNHVAIYLGDDVMLHHMIERLSGREVYGGYWAKHTNMIVRHKSLC